MRIAGAEGALGLIALASSSREPTRQSFSESLRGRLLERGLLLVTAALGRLRGEAVWVVTCERPDGRLLRVEVPVADPPYASPEQVAAEVSSALAAA